MSDFSGVRGRRLAAVAAGLIAVATSVAACSSSGSSNNTSPASSSSSPATASSGSAATGTPIKIGIAVGQTGFNADAQLPTIGVAKAWAANINATGGLDGHPVTLDIKDTQGSPVTVASAVNAMTNGGDAAIVLMDAAGASALTSSKIAIVGVGSYNDPPFEHVPNFFSIATSDNAESRIYSLAAAATGAKKVGEVVCAEVATCVNSATLNKEEAGPLGLTWTGYQEVSASATDYTAPCLALIQKGTDYFALGLSTTVWEKLAPQCLQQGFKGTFGVTVGSFVQTAMDSVKGATFAGGINTFPWWVDNPQVQAFRDVVQKYAPATNWKGEYATGMWASLKLLEKAVAGAHGDVSPAGVLAGFYTIKNETLGGLLPQPITLTAGQPQPLDNCLWLATYKAGDENPQSIHPDLKVLTSQSNGATGDLRSQCVEPLPGS